jgi:hypothetical protein
MTPEDSAGEDVPFEHPYLQSRYKKKTFSVLLSKSPNKVECLSQKEFPAWRNIKPGANPRWEHQKGV